MKPLHVGQIVTVTGGQYNGHGAQVKKIHAVMVEVMINGRLVRLKKGRLGYGENS